MVFNIQQKLAHQTARIHRGRKDPNSAFKEVDSDGNSCQPRLLMQYYYTQWDPATAKLKKHTVTAPSSKIGKMRFATLELASKRCNRIEEVSRYTVVPNRSFRAIQTKPVAAPKPAPAPSQPLTEDQKEFAKLLSKLSKQAATGKAPIVPITK